MAPTVLPEIPVPHAQLVNYLAEHPDTPMTELIEPYRKFESKLRHVYAQERTHDALKDPYINVLPVFTEDTPKILTRARNLEAETEEEKEKYIMALPKEKRRPHSSPAVVGSLKEFQHNFGVFSESSLAELNWNNVVAAGSSVVNTLMPVPKEYKTSKRALREYYHEKYCPASDVDLFLYGLTEEQALEKIKEIETSIRDAILTETTTVRTKHAITICSQYPTRHVQIVLRIYSSVSEILTGFDIDAAGAAYDGSQVYVTPRALQSYMTQINHIDLSRRSPSYENRLSKYSHRNFEVYWPELDRSRIDPTIFERSFQRTLGLARLLVLERLPTRAERDSYIDKRREERGRPALNRTFFRRLHGNIKENYEDEVADWIDAEDVSNYHTFSVPYGVKFNAKKIEKLCYTRDLLLNAEWNQPKDRKVYLHRHPAFFGRAKDCFEDCCGFCPTPTTPEEKEIAEEEAKIYVSGEISFISDDPGRQQIGSFNPLTEDDWTEMAYVGNTARLCQAVVDCDLEQVQDWLAQDGADPNKRDFTGRAPLHLAVANSTPEIVKCLVDAGARLVARLADGKTALHLAAERGNEEIVRLLLEKSLENEEEENDRIARRRLAKLSIKDEKEKPAAAPSGKDDEEESSEDSDEDESDAELVEGDEDSDEDQQSMATGSFVKVSKAKKAGAGGSHVESVPETDDSEPDYYSKDVLAWDVPCSALHLAIVNGHVGVVKLLCEHAVCDVLTPVKFLTSDGKAHAATLSLVLALALPDEEKAREMTRLLLSLGASSAQADMKGVTALHRFVIAGLPSLIGTLFEVDSAAAKVALNTVTLSGSYWSPQVSSPLLTAIGSGDVDLVDRLLRSGASATIDFDTWLKAAKLDSSYSNNLSDITRNTKTFNKTEQPILKAVRTIWPSIALRLLEHGADPNTMTAESYDALANTSSYQYYSGATLLDVVRKQLKDLRAYKGEKPNTYKVKPLAEDMDEYLAENCEAGSYMHWLVSSDIKKLRETYEEQQKAKTKLKAAVEEIAGREEKAAEIKRVIAELEAVEKALLEKGAKTFKDLHPECKPKDKRYDSGSSEESEETLERPPKYKYEYRIFEKRDLTPAQSKAYAELFEACWTGDLAKIKALTLVPWDAEKKEAPLKMAVRDAANNTPFTIAWWRGHQDVARAILDIVHAQYSPAEKKEQRYRMREEYGGGSDEDEEDESDVSDRTSDAGNDLGLLGQVVDKTFTIENVGQVSLQVESHTKVTDFLGWSSPVFSVKDGSASPPSAQCTLWYHCVNLNDAASFKALLELAMKFAALEAAAVDEKDRDESGASAAFKIPDATFKTAIELGRTEILAEMIRVTGAGVPLEHLVKKSGAKMETKSRYYAGLTVYGKKRHDWAAAGRNTMVRPTGSKTAPLLMAARAGCMDTVEWFLSDIPYQKYIEFSESDVGKEDARVKHLNNTRGGFDRAISKWLGMQNDMVIHCVIMNPVTPASLKLVQYLIKVYPSVLDAKSIAGYTPLWLAFKLCRAEYAKLLIEAGADQQAKDTVYSNIVHAALQHLPRPSQLRALLELLDPTARRELLLQRNSLSAAGGTTPLHLFVTKYRKTKEPPKTYYGTPGTSTYDCKPSSAAEIVSLLLSYSSGAELEMLDGAGDTVLHALVSAEWPGAIRAVLDTNPTLLFRENAVGRTPLEVGQARLEAARFTVPEWPGDAQSTYYYNSRNQSRTPQMARFLRRLGAAPERGQSATGRPYRANALRKASPKLFVATSHDDSDDEEDDKDHEQANAIFAGPEATWKVLAAYARRAAAADPAACRRRLVSLNEANDVARRLGETYAKSRYFTGKKRREDGDDDEEGSEAAENEDGAEKKKGESDEADIKKEIEKDGCVVDRYLSSDFGVILPRTKEEREKPCELCGKVHD